MAHIDQWGRPTGLPHDPNPPTTYGLEVTGPEWIGGGRTRQDWDALSDDEFFDAFEVELQRNRHMPMWSELAGGLNPDVHAANINRADQRRRFMGAMGFEDGTTYTYDQGSTAAVPGAGDRMPGSGIGGFDTTSPGGVNTGDMPGMGYTGPGSDGDLGLTAAAGGVAGDAGTGGNIWDETSFWNKLDDRFGSYDPWSQGNMGATLQTGQENLASDIFDTQSDISREFRGLGGQMGAGFGSLRTQFGEGISSLERGQRGIEQNIKRFDDDLGTYGLESIAPRLGRMEEGQAGLGRDISQARTGISGAMASGLEGLGADIGTARQAILSGVDVTRADIASLKTEVGGELLTMGGALSGLSTEVKRIDGDLGLMFEVLGQRITDTGTVVSTGLDQMEARQAAALTHEMGLMGQQVVEVGNRLSSVDYGLGQQIMGMGSKISTMGDGIEDAMGAGFRAAAGETRGLGEALGARIGGLDDRIGGLGDRMAGEALGLGQQIEGLGGRIGGLETGLGGRITGLGDRMAGETLGLGQQIEGLGGRIGGLETGLGDRISSLGGRVGVVESGLGSRIDNLAAELGADVTGLTGNLAGRMRDLGTGLGGRIDVMGDRVRGLDDRIGGLGTRVGAMGDQFGIDMGALGDTVGLLGDDITGLGRTFGDALAGVGGRIGGLDTNLAQAMADIGRLDTGITGLGDRIGGLDSGIAQAILDIGGLDTGIAGAVSDIAGLRGTMSGFGDDIRGLGDDIGWLERDVLGQGRDFTSQLGGLSTQLGGLSTQLGGLGTQISGISPYDDTNLLARLSGLEDTIDTGFEDIYDPTAQLEAILSGIEPLKGIDERFGGILDTWGQEGIDAFVTSLEDMINENISAVDGETGTTGTDVEGPDDTTYGTAGVDDAYSGEDIDLSPIIPEFAPIDDYSQFLQDPLMAAAVSGLTAPDPYDVRRDEILLGQDSEIDALYDTKKETLMNMLAVTNKLGTPIAEAQLRALEEERARSKLSVRSDFGMEAAGAYEDMQTSRQSNLGKVLTQELERQAQLVDQQRSLRRDAMDEFQQFFDQYMTGYYKPQTFEDEALRLLVGGSGTSLAPGEALSGAMGGYGQAGRMGLGNQANLLRIMFGGGDGGIFG